MSRHLIPTVLLVTPLLGACSAAGTDAATSTQAADTTPSATPLYFNHAEAFVSQATYDALGSNAYLNDEFVAVQIRTTVRPDLTYTGTYLNFHNTYVETFPNGTFGEPPGSAGMAMSDEVAGGYEAIVAALQKQFGAANAYTTPITREVNGAQVPWFQLDSTSWSDNSPDFGWWTQEYVPEVAGSTTPGTRTEFLAPVYAPSKLGHNVQMAFYALPDTDRNNLLTTLKALSVRMITVGNVTIAMTARDPEVPRVYYIEPATTGRTGVLGLIFSLNRWTAPHTEQLGDAVLKVAPEGLPVASLWLMSPTREEEAAASILEF